MLFDNWARLTLTLWLNFIECSSVTFSDFCLNQWIASDTNIIYHRKEAQRLSFIIKSLIMLNVERIAKNFFVNMSQLKKLFPIVS